jgi:hypothetical protein
MNKIIYYTVEKETEIGNEEEYITGNKTITIYEIIDNKPQQLFTVECGNEENSKDAIQNYLNDNGMGDDSFNMILL